MGRRRQPPTIDVTDETQEGDIDMSADTIETTDTTEPTEVALLEEITDLSSDMFAQAFKNTRSRNGNNPYDTMIAGMKVGDQKALRVPTKDEEGVNKMKRAIRAAAKKAKVTVDVGNMADWSFVAFRITGRVVQPTPTTAG
jgi:hypothetical protein